MWDLYVTSHEMHWCKSYKKNTCCSVFCSLATYNVKRKTFRSLTNDEKSIKIVGQKLLALASQMF